MKFYIFAVSIFYTISFVAHAGEVLQTLPACYVEDLSKAAAAGVCIAKLRAMGVRVTEIEIMTCNIQAGLLTPTRCR